MFIDEKKLSKKILMAFGLFYDHFLLLIAVVTIQNMFANSAVLIFVVKQIVVIYKNKYFFKDGMKII